MAPLHPALVDALEWTLREYPIKAEELDGIDRFIEDCCQDSVWVFDVTKHASMPASVEERILEAKERNTRRQWLIGFIRRVDNALATLDKQEIKFVNFYYWEHMSTERIALEFEINVRTAYRVKDRILLKLAPVMMPDLVHP